MRGEDGDGERGDGMKRSNVSVVSLAFAATMLGVLAAGWWMLTWEFELIWASDLAYLTEAQRGILLRIARRIVSWLFWPLLASNLLSIAALLLLLRNQRGTPTNAE